MTDPRFALGGMRASALPQHVASVFPAALLNRLFFSSMVLVHFSEIQTAVAVWFISMLFILFHWSMQDWASFYALGPRMSSLRSNYFLRQCLSGCFLLFFEFLMLWIYKSLGSWVAGQCFLEFCWLSGNSVDYYHCSAQLFRVLGSQHLGLLLLPALLQSYLKHWWLHQYLEVFLLKLIIVVISQFKV